MKAESILNMTRSRWQLIGLLAVPPSRSWNPAKFSARKSCESGDI